MSTTPYVPRSTHKSKSKSNESNESNEPSGSHLEPLFEYPLTIALLGIDGAGKSTIADIIAADLQAAGIPAQIMRNPGGRRWMSRLADRFGTRLPSALANRLEWTVRCTNVIYSHTCAAMFSGVTIMDRHIPCQLVLQAVRGLPASKTLSWFLARLPVPDALVLIDSPAALAFQRIEARGEDHESMPYLSAAREAYLEIARCRGWVILDGSATPREVADALTHAVRRRAEQH